MKIRITNLDRSTTDADLRDLFEEFGEVMYAFVTKRSKTGGRTFTGYVEMPDDDEAQ
jgi:RNA recognition motif-containing protein